MGLTLYVSMNTFAHQIQISPINKYNQPFRAKNVVSGWSFHLKVVSLHLENKKEEDNGVKF